jgi:hypothetical protein
MADILANSIPSMAAFMPDVEPNSVAPRWKRWSERFENLIIAMNVTDQARKKALLLHLAGEAVFEIFEGLVLDDIPDDADATVTNVYTVAKKALDDHFNPKKNTEFERFNFRSAKQQPIENIDSYHVRLRSLAKHCEFANVDAEIKSHIIQTCRSTRLRRRALTDATLTLKALIDLGRSMELTEQQTQLIESGPHQTGNSEADSRDQTVAQVRNRAGDRRAHVNARKQPPATLCRNCGKSYPHEGGPSNCPAWGTQCRSCGRYNHWSEQCRSTQKTYGQPDQQRHNFTTSRGRGRGSGQRISGFQRQRVNQVGTYRGDTVADYPDYNQCRDESDCSDDEGDGTAYVFTVRNSKQRNSPTVKLSIQGTLIPFMIDTGASVNIIDEGTFSKLKIRPELEKATSRLFAYGANHPIKIKGKFQTAAESKDKITHATFHVAAGSHGSLLSYQTATALNLIHIDVNCVNKVIANDVRPITVNDLVKSHPTLFEGIGKLKNFQVKLHIDETVKPVAQPHRRVPFHDCTGFKRPKRRH